MMSPRRGAAYKIFALCWLVALALHLAWLPNLLWFIELPRLPRTASVEVVPLSPAPSRGADSERGEGALGRRLPEIELPGMAPGGRSHVVAPRVHEWERSSLWRRQSWAARAPDWAAQPQPYRDGSPGRPRSPAELVAALDAAHDDIRLAGFPSRNSSVLRRLGDGPSGDVDGAVGRGGEANPWRGNRVALADGELSAASAEAGLVEPSRVARTGARPRVARPAVTRAQSATDAPETGPLSGSPSRQAAPRLAWSDPVREARRASGASSQRQDEVAGPFRSERGQGTSAGRRGPGTRGRGRGTSGAGSAANSLLDDYIRATTARIRDRWGFPERLAYGLEQGLVVLEVRIRHDGRVEQITIQRSSGFEEFDQTAVEAVRLAEPLAPPPPEELFRRGRNYLVLSLPMHYRNPMFE